TGGRLPAVEPLARGAALDPGMPGRVKQSQPIPHVIPLVFQGPKPGGGLPAGEAAVKVSGGMSQDFVADSLLREAGAWAGSVPLQGGGDASGGGGSYSNVTNLTIVVPPHEGVGGLGGLRPMAAPTNMPPSGLWLNRSPGWNSNVAPIPGIQRGAYGPVHGVTEDGTFRSASGRTLYDPATGRTTPSPNR
ncbi:MAG TPA: hypothetical protein VEJ18_17505, partial [Planctomycetota bacterium]|nr:hypothetical protein [Planctomycetota bacterium]